MDVHSRETRSRNMRAIKNKNTQPERLIRSALHKKGYRFRIAPSNIEGKPDIWLPKWRAAIFVNGCFWHAHNCSYFRWPKTRTEFWEKKLNGNRERDKKQHQNLRGEGIRVLIIWECTIRGKNSLGAETVAMLADTWLRSDALSGEILTTGLNITN